MLPLEPEKSVPGYQDQWRYLTQLMTLDAMSKAGRGDIDAALEIYDVLLNFAVESGRGGLVVYQLQATACQRIVVSQLCKTLQAPAVSAGQCRAALGFLTALEAKAPTVADGMAVEAAASEYWHKRETPDTIRNSMRSAAKSWDDAGKQFVENASAEDLLEYGRQFLEIRKQLIPLFR